MFQTGVFPDLGLSFLFCPFLSFWDFPGDFPDLLGYSPGIFPICPFPLSRPLLSAPTRNSLERVRDTIWTCPEKSGKHPGLETPPFSFSQERKSKKIDERPRTHPIRTHRILPFSPWRFCLPSAIFLKTRASSTRMSSSPKVLVLDRCFSSEKPYYYHGDSLVWTVLSERALQLQTEPSSQFSQISLICRFSVFLGLALGRCRFLQKTAGNRRFSQQTADFCRNRRKPKGDGGKGTGKTMSRQFATNVTTIYDMSQQFATFYDNFRLFIPLT